MSESTGGHALDTGEGPVLLDHPSGRRRETSAATAWSAYTDHTRACEACRPSPQQCPTANTLWAEYTNTRHLA